MKCSIPTRGFLLKKFTLHDTLDLLKVWKSQKISALNAWVRRKTGNLDLLFTSSSKWVINYSAFYRLKQDYLDKVQTKPFVSCRTRTMYPTSNTQKSISIMLQLSTIFLKAKLRIAVCGKSSLRRRPDMPIGSTSSHEPRPVLSKEPRVLLLPKIKTETALHSHIEVEEVRILWHSGWDLSAYISSFSPTAATRIRYCRHYVFEDKLNWKSSGAETGYIRQRARIKSWHQASHCITWKAAWRRRAAVRSLVSGTGSSSLAQCLQAVQPV